jgi:outer membrane receptor protein involved in Fe transport
LIGAGNYYRAIGDVRPAPPSYVLAGFNASWHSAGGAIAATAGLRNAFNTLAIEPTSVTIGPIPGIPLPGRELYLTLTLRE